MGLAKAQLPPQSQADERIVLHTVPFGFLSRVKGFLLLNMVLEETCFSVGYAKIDVKEIQQHTLQLPNKTLLPCNSLQSEKKT